MATLFQSFRSSTMPKRLLRYALSRLELLEEDTLDMENLEFALGRNTTLEFRDVGVKLKKLERLLKLPATFKLEKAKVLKLTVTIPMDFYTSPIIVEVDGVDVRLKVSGSQDSKGRGKQTTKTSEETKVVPNTVDLAQSFLETQPLAETKKLEDALAAETQDLGASVAMSESSMSEDESPFGTGQPLSLPAFLADFLQGIVDRTQVRIQGVTFQLDVEVPVEANATTPDLVTFQIALDRIDVEGVTAEAHDENGTPTIVPKEGKRHIALTQIRAYLISEANVFSTLARSPSMSSSPAISQSPGPSERTLPSRQSTAFRPNLQDSFLSDSVDLTEADDLLLQDSEDAFNIPYDFSSQPEEEIEEENTNTPRASIYQDFAVGPRVPISYSTVMEDEEVLPWGGHGRETRSEPALQPFREMEEREIEAAGTSEGSQHSSPASSSSGPAVDEDLARSQLFTHEDAESMYMSAFSEAQSQQIQPRMPGSWDPDSSPESSPISKRTAPEPRPLSPPGFEAEKVEEEPAMSGPVETESLEVPVEAQPEVETEVEEPAKVEAEVDTAEENDPPFVPPQEDVATPRGPTRLVKELLSLASISIYVPSLHKHLHITPGVQGSVSNLSGTTYGLGKSVAPQVPGAFSVYSTSPAMRSSTAARSPPLEHAESHNDDSLEVILSPLEIRFDASLGFLLAMVVSKLLDALKGQENTSSKPAEATKTSADSPLPDIKVVAEKISIHFLHQLGGVADTAERMLGTPGLQLQPDILLRAALENLTISHKTVKSSTETSIDLERFRFGYAKDDIISFDQSLQMRASVMDKFPSAGAEVSVKVIQSSGSIRTEVTTLPLLVQLDLQRLDETFSWFGGLSSFLNMSSSMTSSASPSVKSSVQPPPKPRGVRFEAPINPDDKSNSSENKIDMRIGGFNLDLQGKECSVGLETSAVKMVSRDEGVGFAISKIRLAGPYLRNSRGDPPISADISGVRFEFLTSPKDKDLDRLLGLILPSKVKFDQGDDEIMVDTLLRQRRKGPVLRVTLDQFNVRVGRMQQLTCLPGLGEELARLATVAKYLPEDDRPGLLTLGRIKDMGLVLDFGGKLGVVNTSMKEFEVAHITLPSLVAFGLSSLFVNRNNREDLVSSPTTLPSGVLTQGPVLMLRMIGDEMEPVVKIKMRDLTIDYRVPTIMDVLGLAADSTPQDFEASLAASVANLGEHAHTALGGKQPMAPRPLDSSKANSKPMTVDLVFQDCLLGLNPLGLTSRLVIALTDARLAVGLPKEIDTEATLYLNKASILLIDDISSADNQDTHSNHRQRLNDTTSQQVAELVSKGYVNICYISSAKAVVKLTVTPEDGEKHVDVELRDDLLVLETCADSTQTLITLANALKPPTPPSKENKYRTKVVPVQDLLASISAEAFGKAEGDYDFDNDFAIAQELGGDEEYDPAGDESPLQVDSRYYEEAPVGEQLFDAEGSMMSDVTTTQDTNDGVLLTNFNASSSHISDDGSDLAIQENYFGKGPAADGRAHIWNSSRNSYDHAPDELVKKSPLRVSVRDVHVIWNLFDGYDWARTRDVISKAVQDVENKAYERRQRTERRTAYEEEIEDEETVIGDFLFNSIYIGIPANRDPRELAQAINQELNDNATETESIATTAVTATTSRAGGTHRSKKRLKLNRSRHHKITFELKGVNVDLIAFAPDSGETQSSIDVRVQNLDVFDHVPTSTWKKFVTYDQDAGEREMGTSMVQIKLLNVKPIADLAASEIVLRATLLPLRLHVDQDALDFITRFFEFKDDSVPVHSSPSDVPFLQRVEVTDIPVKLDFKPKRVDYAGLRSGHTTEFMNFIVLDEARLVLRHTIIYGVSGFDRMGKTLNDIWMPDVKRNQLPGVLAGLAPVRSLVNVGSGFKDLIEIPIREYQKDGRVIRSISKGAAAFARTTGTEIVKLGAKLAIGTQYALQGAEGMLTNPQPEATWEDDDLDPEERKQISLYADQPTGVIQGLRGGYSSLTRDLNMARDAIIAVPGEVMESQSAQGLARAVLKRAPTIIFRPAIGATKAIGQTLMGATNTLDPQNRRRVEEKYKKH